MSFVHFDCVTCKVRDCSILKGCDQLTLKAINDTKHSYYLDPGQKLFCEGDPVEGIYFIKKGFVKIELNGKEGRPLILSIAGKGTILGHRSLAKQTVHHCSVKALSKVTYCVIPHDIFAEISDKNTHLKQLIFDACLTELLLAEKKALSLAHKTVREKVAEALVNLANLYQYEEKKLSFRVDFYRQDIADLAGTTKEQVSKTLKDFEAKGYIKCTGKRFNYLHINSLRTISGQPA